MNHERKFVAVIVDALAYFESIGIYYGVSGESGGRAWADAEDALGEEISLHQRDMIRDRSGAYNGLADRDAARSLLLRLLPHFLPYACYGPRPMPRSVSKLVSMLRRGAVPHGQDIFNAWEELELGNGWGSVTGAQRDEHTVAKELVAYLWDLCAPEA